MTVNTSTQPHMQAIDSPKRKREWDWRKDLNYFFVALTEILWLVPLLEFVRLEVKEMYPQSVGYAFVLVSGNFLGGLLLRRYIFFRRIDPSRHFIAFLFFMAIGVVITLACFPILTGRGAHPDFDLRHAFDTTLAGDTMPYGILYMPIVMFLWARGFRIGRTLLTHVGVSIQMRLGIMVYFLIGLLGTAEIRDNMLTLMPIFFGAALMSTALARSATLHIEDDMKQSRFGLSWLGFLMGTTGVITLGGFFMSLVFAGIDQNKVAEVIKAIAYGTVAIVLLILSPFLWLFERFIYFMRSVAANARSPQVAEEGGKIVPEKANDVDRLNYGDTLNSVLGFLGDATLYTIFGLIVVSAIIFWIMVIFTRDDQNLDNDRSESIDERELVGGLRKAVGNQLKKVADALNLVRQFGVGRGLMGVLTIRWAYARMENEAKKRGFPRAKAETPYEYRRVAAKAYPGGEDHIKTITEAYVSIRYGEIPEDKEDLNKVRMALDSLMEISKPV